MAHDLVAAAYDARIARERLRLRIATGDKDRASGEREIVELTQAINAAAEPITALAEQLGIDRRDQDFLAFVIACCTDPVCATALHRLQGSSSAYGASIASYAAISESGDDARALALALATDHPLVLHAILESRSDAAITPALRIWAVTPRVPRFLLGSDDIAAPLVRADVPEIALFDEDQRAAIDELASLLDAGRRVTVALEGPTGSGRATAVAVAASALGRSAVVLSLDHMDRSIEVLEDGLRALRREVALTGAIAIIRGIEDVNAVDQQPRRWRLEQFVARFAGPLVVTTTFAGQALRFAGKLVRRPWAPSKFDARRNMWSVLLAHVDPGHQLTEPDLDQLGQRYTIGPGVMREAITAARAASPQPLTMAGVVSALRQRTTERLTGLTTHVAVGQDWNDLVIARDTRDQIDALVARVRLSHQVLDRWGLGKRVGRATGVAALFSGPPGTGKTMVAGLVAKELGLDLHQIELSQVLSKWIGETEKQLAQIFDAAGTGHCLLLFDEADALFTKRTEVKSSNDRYSNLEVNFLLQRMEAFRGIVILTTNLDSSLDPAFKRRLASHVVFWPPDDDERAQLWRSFLSTDMPLAGDLDIDRLVEGFPDLSGAHIRNAVINAAFAAARGDKHVTQAALESAARNEYASMGRVLSRSART